MIEEQMHPTPSTIDDVAQDPTFSLAIAFERFKRKVKKTSAFQSFRYHFHIPPPQIRHPIITIGTIRSGSTVLAKCLGKHPSILYTDSELSTEWCDLANIEIARSGSHCLNCPPYRGLDATATRCNRVRNGFADILAREGGGPNTRILNQNPHLWNKLPFLRKIFPDAKLIITSRDLRSTVASIKQLWLRQNRKSGKKYYFPTDRECCWLVIPPASPNEREASRIFPGGDVVALAEFWLHTYEMIEKTIEGFTHSILVKHRDFISNPNEVLAKIYETVNVPPIRTPLTEKLDPTRNDRWPEILTPHEQTKLEAFIASHHSRIERLKYADTTL